MGTTVYLGIWAGSGSGERTAQRSTLFTILWSAMWTREDQRAAFQGPPVALLCLRTESPLTRQQFHVMKLLIDSALIRMDCTWKMSHDVRMMMMLFKQHFMR
jgi:hypothetical protein